MYSLSSPSDINEPVHKNQGWNAQGGRNASSGACARAYVCASTHTHMLCKLSLGGTPGFAVFLCVFYMKKSMRFGEVYNAISICYIHCSNFPHFRMQLTWDTRTCVFRRVCLKVGWRHWRNSPCSRCKILSEFRFDPIVFYLTFPPSPQCLYETKVF